MTPTLETSLDVQRAALQRQVRDLHEREPVLAQQAAAGSATAQTELARVSATIAAAERSLERLTLVERESRRLLELQAGRGSAAGESTHLMEYEAQRAALEQRRLETAYQQDLADRQAAYRMVERATGELVTRTQRAVAVGDRLQEVSAQLDRPEVADSTRRATAEYLLTKLAAALPGLVPYPGRVRLYLADPVPHEVGRP